MDRAGAEAEIDRRRRATWLNFQTGRPLLAPVARGWIDGGHKTCTRPSRDKHPWLTQLLARRPAKVVAVALANKMARIAWAVLARGGTYRAPALAARV